MKDGRKTTQIERIEIAQWTIANDYNYGAAMQQFKISYGQVYAWVKKFKQGGESALEDRRGKAKKDNGQLTEIERLKLENKRLQARLVHVSTEAAVLKNSKNWKEGMPVRRTISDHSTTCTRSEPRRRQVLRY